MGRRIHVCNGDADGLCAALQWRLHDTAPDLLVTGMKREIELLERVRAGAGDEVCVFDISIQRNHDSLLRLLDAGASVRYFDHHAAPDVPSHALLEAHLDTSSGVCTSLLVDRWIGGAFRAWALVGAYGDNLAPAADRLGQGSGIDAADRVRLRCLGEAINYNAYGDDEGDARIAPHRLYAILVRYRDPREMLASEHVFDEIDAVRRDDLDRAMRVPPHWQSPTACAYVLDDAPWSRRVLGSFANECANAEPARAHAVLKRRGDALAVSVRSPLLAPSGADTLCARFGGGGRARAAGVDHLPASDLDRFVAAFGAAWSAAPEPAP